MSSHPRLARLATQALARHRAEAPTPTPADDARAIAAIAGAITREARARRTRRAIASCAGAVGVAACLALAVGAMRSSSRTAAPSPARAITRVAVNAPSVEATGHAVAGAVVVLHEGRAISLDGGSPLLAGDRLVAPADGRASIALSTGTHLLVEGGADFDLVDLGREQRFSLRAGAVHADVAKLGDGQRFILRTVDAEIEVRGTSFRVAVVTPTTACGDGSSTRVSVTEGTVVVRHAGTESRVSAGADWPAACAPVPATQAAPSALSDPPPSPAPSLSLVPVPVPALAVSPPARGRATTPAPPSSSDLADQNRLLAEATSARRRGSTSEAIAAYDAFLARYPSSQGAEGAMVERMRLVASTSRAAGAAAAREYLRRYPTGYAQKEATDLAAPAP